MTPKLWLLFWWHALPRVVGFALLNVVAGVALSLAAGGIVALFAALVAVAVGGNPPAVAYWTMVVAGTVVFVANTALGWAGLARDVSERVTWMKNELAKLDEEE